MPYRTHDKVPIQIIEEAFDIQIDHPDEVVLPQPEWLTLRPFYRAEVYTAALHRASIVPTRHHKPHRKTDCVIRWNRFPDLSPFSSDNQSSPGYDEQHREFRDVIEFARASRQRLTTVPRTRKRKSSTHDLIDSYFPYFSACPVFYRLKRMSRMMED
jgi:hypothetical protein